MNQLTFRQIFDGIEGILVIMACYLTFFLRRRRSRWGLTKDDVTAVFPGDDLVVDPDVHFTHGITIQAPSSYVWPWIAQIGRGRGGFYSYELLENITGLDIYNSDTVLKDFQQPEIGDFVEFGPNDKSPIILCEPGKYMAIENWIDFQSQGSFDPSTYTSNSFMHLTWLWYVEPINKTSARFYSRNRVDITSKSKWPGLIAALTEPIVFAMDRKMCKGIKHRAERLFAHTDNTIPPKP